MDSPASMSSGLEATLVSYHSLPENHWTLLKKSEDVSVWRRPSELFSGFLYKTEGTVADEPQRIVDHIRPGPQRLHWDSLMTTLEILDTLEQDCCVVKYTTAGQLWNIISPRQFVDFSYTTSYQSGLLSCGVSIEREPHEPGFVRGFNHPCGWFCVPAEGRSLLTGYIQTDLKGLLPHAAVDKAMANGLIRFYDDLRRALKPHKK